MSYEEAVAKNDLVFVETHCPPIDDQPAIDLVRDGRKVVRSYLQFPSDFSGNATATTLSLILGYDENGSWAGHLSSCSSGTRPKTSLVRYEDLIQISEGQLMELARSVQ